MKKNSDSNSKNFKFQESKGGNFSEYILDLSPLAYKCKNMRRKCTGGKVSSST